jgi:hypothetical protein
MGFEDGVLARYMDDTGIEENRNNFKIVVYTQKDQTVYVKLKFGISSYWSFEFAKFNNKWLIDKINGDFPKVIPYYPNHNYNECCGK